MDIDIVYTWVNEKDLEWKKRRQEFAKKETGIDLQYRAGEARFQDNNELRYSLRSIEKYFPSVRNIFIVHTGAAPEWLKNNNQDLFFISQESILPSHCRPVYQSDVIEAFLYKIPGLAEHYIYANDDFFFCHPHQVSDFFDSEGRARVGIRQRLAGEGKKAALTFRQSERNSARAIKKHITIPKPITVSYPWIPLPIRCMLKKCLPINTMAHVAQPFRKSIWEDFHNVFSEEIKILCQSRFRSPNGFATNLMANHYALSIGKAVFDYQDQNDYLGRGQPLEDRIAFKKDLQENSSKIRRFCLNDEVSNGEDGWNDYVSELLNGFFPEPSRWEIV